MTERAAMRIVYASSLILTTVVVLGLWLLGAPTDAIGVGWMVVLIGGATAAGRVTMHYAPSRRRRDD